MAVWNTLFNIIDMVGQTPFEKLTNITIIRKEIIKDFGDMKLLAVHKSNGEVGLVILFKPAIKTDLWDRWYPSENQLNYLPEIKKIYDEINNHNSTKWKN